MSENAGHEPEPGHPANTTTPGTLNARELAVAERKAARKVSLDGFRWLLITALVLYVLSLVLPLKSGVLGIQALTFSSEVTIAESVFSLTTFLGLGLFNLLLLLTRRTWFSYLSWFFTGVSLFYSLFALWMRGTDAGGDNSTGIGVYLSILGVALATFALSSIILRRSPEQKALAQQRATVVDTDPIAATQREMMLSHQEHNYEDNPLFNDNRRAEAGERHLRRRRAGQSGQD